MENDQPIDKISIYEELVSEERSFFIMVMHNTIAQQKVLQSNVYRLQIRINLFACKLLPKIRRIPFAGEFF